MSNIDQVPSVFIKDGNVYANSRDVAAFFEKDVRHVHEAIRSLVYKEPEWCHANFRPFKINDLTGESTSHFEMTRDGFALLAMSFTGSRALKFKLAYIAQFNAMEEELRQRDDEEQVIIRWDGRLAVEAVSKVEAGTKNFGERSAFGQPYRGPYGGTCRDGVVIIGRVLERRSPERTASALAPLKTRARSAEIIPLLRAGLTPLQVVARTGAHENTVYRWRKRLAG